MRKFIARSFFVILLLFFMGGCSTRDSAIIKQKRVAVLIPGAVEFFAIEKKGMIKAAEKYDLELIFAYAQWDAAKQLDQIERILSEGVDLIALCAVDSEILKAAVPIVSKTKIPFITFTNVIGDSPTGEYPGALAHVGRNEIYSGKMLVDMLEKQDLNKNSKILLVQGAPGTAPQVQRKKGFMQALAKYPGWSVVADPAIEGWSKEAALHEIEDLIASGGSFDAVVCQWSGCAVAASMALKSSNIKNKTIVGLEFSSEIIPYIERKDIHATSYFSIEEEGYKTIELANSVLSGKEYKKFEEIVPIIVDIENFNKFRAEM